MYRGSVRFDSLKNTTINWTTNNFHTHSFFVPLVLTHNNIRKGGLRKHRTSQAGKKNQTNQELWLYLLKQVSFSAKSRRKKRRLFCLDYYIRVEVSQGVSLLQHDSNQRSYTSRMWPSTDLAGLLYGTLTPSPHIPCKSRQANVHNTM